MLQLKDRDITSNIARLSRFFRLSRATFYRQPKLPPKDELLKEKILSVLSIHPSYGHRRIAIALDIGKKRARRIMRLYGIKPYKRKARWRKRRDLRRKPAPYTNLIKYFCPIKPNLTWVSDFTYIRFKSKFYYLSTFMDLFTREVVGWNVSSRHTSEFVINAFIDGFKNKGIIPKIVHSDQGSEYNCKDYINLMDYLNIQISMAKKQSPWENGHQESFYNNFKTDLGLEFDRFDTIGHLVEGIHHAINYYNQDRIHTTLKMSPYQFRQQYQQIHLEKCV